MKNHHISMNQLKIDLHMRKKVSRHSQLFDFHILFFFQYIHSFNKRIEKEKNLPVTTCPKIGYLLQEPATTLIVLFSLQSSFEHRSPFNCPQSCFIFYYFRYDCYCYDLREFIKILNMNLHHSKK